MLSLASLPVLLCLSLGQFASLDNLGLRLAVPKHRRGHEHADLLLILAVLGVLAGSNQLREPRRSLEQHDQERGAGKGVAVQHLGRVATPLVQHEPDHLLSEEVGVAAVSPQAPGHETTVEILLRPAAGHLLVLEVRVLGGLVVPLLAVGNVLAQDEADDNGEEGPVRGGNRGLDAAGEEEGVGRRGREGEEEDGLNEGDEGHVEDEEDDGRDLFADDFPSVVLASTFVSALAPVVEGQSTLEAHMVSWRRTKAWVGWGYSRSRA